MLEFLRYREKLSGESFSRSARLWQSSIARAASPPDSPAANTNARVETGL
jgi:hypothetical protein